MIEPADPLPLAAPGAGAQVFDTPSGRRPQDWAAPLATRAHGDRDLERVIGRVEDGERIDAEEALLLHERADLTTLGRLADLVRRRKHPGGVVTYIIDRNVNPTNVCLTDCGFCAFYRSPGDVEAYVLSRGEIYDKVAELEALGGRQVLMQGGHHPRILSEWWGQLISDLKERFPTVNSHALSAPSWTTSASTRSGRSRRSSATSRTRASAACRARAPRCSSSGCARSSPRRRRPPTDGSTSTARCTRRGCVRARR